MQRRQRDEAAAEWDRISWLFDHARPPQFVKSMGCVYEIFELVFRNPPDLTIPARSYCFSARKYHSHSPLLFLKIAASDQIETEWAATRLLSQSPRFSKPFDHGTTLWRNIISKNAYDYFPDPDTDNPPKLCFIVSELIQGANLCDFIQEFAGKLPFQYFVQIATEVVRAVNELHALGIVHCDIKPGNFIITESLNVILVDYGISMLIGQVQDHGTPGFMAPEMIGRSGTVAQASRDVWALGATLYPLWKGRERPEFENNVDIGDGAEHMMTRLLLSMMGRDPEMRPTCPEVLQIMTHFLS
jgi:serine/threonine protein kinase